MVSHPTKEIRCRRIGEACVRIDHPSGLPIFLCPKPGYRSSYAVFATRYGSLDTTCRDAQGKVVPVPEGIAHYLEHKLFENEDCDAFQRYAATGASANAYTSFDHTAYLFTCTGRLTDSLEILLDFVQAPYFTEETVAKEQGIIGQEIRMLEDSPARRTLFNLLRALYVRHPVRVDIGGTVESISRITPELLYSCYHTYYDLRNMALAVAGDFSPEEVLAVADRLLKPAPDTPSPALLRKPPVESFREPAEIARERVEEAMPVAAPLFYLGYKALLPENEAGRYPTAAEEAGSAVLLELLAGKASPLYARLMEQGLINEQFGASYFSGPGFGCYLFGGESADPDAVCAAIREEVARLQREGLDQQAFERSRRAVYGRLAAAYNDVENCADAVVADYFSGREPYALIDETAALGVEWVTKLLRENLRAERSAISVIRPEA